MRYYEMPVFDENAVSRLETEFEKDIFSIITKSNVLRRTFPSGKKFEEIVETFAMKHNLPHNEGKWVLYFVWRNVAFYISPCREHQCLPFVAYFKYSDELFRDREYVKFLEKVVDNITNLIPPQQWHGVRRWAGLL